MKKLLSFALVMALGLMVGLSLAHVYRVSPTPARATHINEPVHPIIALELIIEKYDDNLHLDCSGGYTAFPVSPARKLRIMPLVNMSVQDWQTGDPSEHFSVGWQIDQRIANPNKPNTFNWEMEERTVWPHSNQPSHTGSHQFNVAYATITPGQPNGGSSTNLEPGVYRIKVEVLTDVSQAHFVAVCGFTVV